MGERRHSAVFERDTLGHAGYVRGSTVGTADLRFHDPHASGRRHLRVDLDHSQQSMKFVDSLRPFHLSN